MIAISIHFFVFRRLYIQGYISIAVLTLGVFLFLIRNFLNRWIEFVTVGYLLLLVIFIGINLKIVLKPLNYLESFNFGYNTALVVRLLGYHVVKVQYMIVMHIIVFIPRIIILHEYSASTTLLTTMFEVSTIYLSFKSDRGERDLFDSLYKSKKQLIKFRKFLTEHLPSGMAIFAKDYSRPFYMNNAFRKSFHCRNISMLKASMTTLSIGKETIEKNWAIFSRLGYTLNTQEPPLKLSGFLELVAKNVDVIKDFQSLTLEVYETEDYVDISKEKLAKHSKILQQSKEGSKTSSILKLPAKDARRPMKSKTSLKNAKNTLMKIIRKGATLSNFSFQENKKDDLQ